LILSVSLCALCGEAFSPSRRHTKYKSVTTEGTEAHRGNTETESVLTRHIERVPRALKLVRVLFHRLHSLCALMVKFF
jgi:hypothetical protein